MRWNCSTGSKAGHSSVLSYGYLLTLVVQASGLWYLREGIAESLSKSGAVYKYDVSLPLPKMYELVRDTRARLKDIADAKIYGYGHLGDGSFSSLLSFLFFSTYSLFCLSFSSLFTKRKPSPQCSCAQIRRESSISNRTLRLRIHK